MSHPCASDILEMLRTLMHHLEDAPAYDPANTEFVKRIIRHRIGAVESIYRLAVEQASFDSVSSSTEKLLRCH